VSPAKNKPEARPRPRKPLAIQWNAPGIPEATSTFHQTLIDLKTAANSITRLPSLIADYFAIQRFNWSTSIFASSRAHERPLAASGLYN
jgi:hypothetical protein